MHMHMHVPCLPLFTRGIAIYTKGNGGKEKDEQ